MADNIEPMCCEVVCSLDGGETEFLCVCACGMTVDNGISFLFDGVPVKGHRSALFFVDLLFYVGWDSRYSEEAPLSVLFVVEWNLIWAISLVAEKQLFRVLSSNVVLSVCACESCFW